PLFGGLAQSLSEARKATQNCLGLLRAQIIIMLKKRGELRGPKNGVFHALQLPAKVEQRDQDAVHMCFVQALHRRSSVCSFLYSLSRPSEGLATGPAGAVSSCGTSSSTIGAAGNKCRGKKNALA